VKPFWSSPSWFLLQPEVTSEGGAKDSAGSLVLMGRRDPERFMFGSKVLVRGNKTSFVIKLIIRP